MFGVRSVSNSLNIEATNEYDNATVTTRINGTPNFNPEWPAGWSGTVASSFRSNGIMWWGRSHSASMITQVALWFRVLFRPHGRVNQPIPLHRPVNPCICLRIPMVDQIRILNTFESSQYLYQWRKLRSSPRRQVYHRSHIHCYSLCNRRSSNLLYFERYRAVDRELALYCSGASEPGRYVEGNRDC
jgi:hypothetical protein